MLGLRCCICYFFNGRFIEEVLEKIFLFLEIFIFNRIFIVDMFMYLRDIVLLNGGKRIDFDDLNVLSD